MAINFNDFLPGALNAPEVQAFFMGFPVSLLHAGAALIVLIIGATIYSLLSPNKEIAQIRDGNAAAATSYGGMLFTLALPLASALGASHATAEIFIWGAASVLVQLVVFRLIDLVLTGLPARVRDGEVSAAVLLVAAKLACALILSAAVGA